MIFLLFLPVILSTAAVAQTILTGPTQCLASGQYNLCQNQFASSSGTGTQTSSIVLTSGDSIRWTTFWNWQDNPNAIKSFTNVQSTTALGVKLNNIASAPSTFVWTYFTQSSGLRADISYSIWLGSASSGAPASAASSYRVNIWISGRGGIQPTGSQIHTGLNIAGYTWNLWSGPSSNWNVFSFVSASGDIPNFTADLNPFFQYLVQSQGVPGTQYVQAIQSGTEPFTGVATLVVGNFSVSINPGTPPSTIIG